MDCSTRGFPVLHHLLELAQTHVHWVSDAIQPSHPLSSFPPAFNLCPAWGSFQDEKQTAMSQMLGKDKTPEKQLNEVEIGNLPEKELRTTIVKMIQNLRKTMEKMQKMFTTDLLLNWGVGENSWELLGLQGDPTSPSWRRSVLGVHCKDWCWSWSSNTLATSCEELTHWKRPWCWERLRAEGEGDDREWDGWMAALTQWTWVWVDSGSWWWTGRPGVLRFMGSQRVRHDWATELNWTELN